MTQIRVPDHKQVSLEPCSVTKMITVLYFLSPIKVFNYSPGRYEEKNALDSAFGALLAKKLPI